MKRYSTVRGSVCISNKAYKMPDTEYGDSVVDKSKFRPTLVNNGSGQRVVGSPMIGMYDFPDGVDTGVRLGVIRSPSADITEIDAVSEYLKSRVDSQVFDAKEKLNDVIKDIKMDFKEGTSTPSDSPQNNGGA